MTEIKTDFEIRQAEEKDVPEIFELIKALAEFENLSDEVVATEELLKITLFGINSPAEVQIATTKIKPWALHCIFARFLLFWDVQEFIWRICMCGKAPEEKALEKHYSVD